jgi:hypothetical protein
MCQGPFRYESRARRAKMCRTGQRRRSHHDITMTLFGSLVVDPTMSHYAMSTKVDLPVCAGTMHVHNKRRESV